MKIPFTGSLKRILLKEHGRWFYGGILLLWLAVLSCSSIKNYFLLLILSLPASIFCFSRFYIAIKKKSLPNRMINFRGFNNIDSVRLSIKLVLGFIKSDILFKKFKGINLDDFGGFDLDIKDSCYLKEKTFTTAQLIAKSINLNAFSFSVALNQNLNKLARVQYVKNGISPIEVNPKYIHNNFALFGALAHELTHVFLFEKNLKFENEYENEILTDVTSVLLGVGCLSLISYMITVESSEKLSGTVTTTTTTNKIGYLTLDEFAYVQARRDVIIGKRDVFRFDSYTTEDAYKSVLKVVQSEISSPPSKKASLFNKLLYKFRRHKILTSKDTKKLFNNDYYSFFFTDIARIEFYCPACTQKLRAPLMHDDKKSINLKCTNCNFIFPCTL